MDLRGEEPRRALVSWEMIYSGNYLKPMIQAWPYYNKPPIFNWVVVGFFQIFGDANWVVRVPSILAFLGMGVVHYRFTRIYLGAQVALWSVLFLFTGVHLLYFATVLSGELDLFYAFFVYLQAIIIFHYFHKKQWLKLFILSYLLVALGFMIKGLPSIAYQGLTLIAMAIYYRKWRWFFSWQHILGGLIGVAAMAIYFVIYDQYYGHGLLYFYNLIEEASQKSAAEGQLMEILSHIAEFPLQYIVDQLPWSLLLLLLLKKENRNQLKEHPFLVFCLLFFVANIWLYWISPGGRNRYLYGFAPFFFTPLAYLYLKKPLIALPRLLIVLCVLVGGRIGYNYTVMAYQQKTMKNILLYRQIVDDALEYSEGQALMTCCKPDTIHVDPSIAGQAILQDTIFIPMYLPYQIPFYLQRARDEIIPFETSLEKPGYYLSTDTVMGKPIKSYPVWDNKTLHLFELPDKAGK